MEDIDAAFTHGITRDISGTDLEDPRIRALSQRTMATLRMIPMTSKMGDEVAVASLNPVDPISHSRDALDGISAQEGLMLFATTNRYHALDPALTCPGRMDLHVEFHLASRHQGAVQALLHSGHPRG
ncbi:hypothetical protein EDB84DRAFT_1487257 [Lactarius hengduanensis]|nr:hypothetical protein EDB84DRAFT_1487257 [Lactarius hengduanensis]